MRSVASFVMQGRLQATAAVVLTTVLLLLTQLQPLVLFGSAGLALVTLRRGALDGAAVMLLAATACTIVLLLFQADPILVFGSMLLLWLPVWGLALLLRYGRALGMMVAAALMVGVVLAVALYLYTSVDELVKTLGPHISVMLEQGQILEPEQHQAFIESLVGWVPGIIATLFFLQLVAVLLLARWWQSLLYNPGGFRAEFLQLRLPNGVAIVTVAVLLLNLTGIKLSGMLLDYLILLLLSAFFVHGLALVHGLIDKHGANTSWLIGMYVLLIIFMPYAESLLSAAGLADSWFDFRARPVADGGGVE
jgi:hypothetical protein